MGWVILFSIDKPAIYDESGFYDSLIKIIFFIFVIMIIPGISVSIRRLQTEVWGYKSKLETHTVETHVYRLRKKVEKSFNDKSFILSFKNGYKIEK